MRDGFKKFNNKDWGTDLQPRITENSQTQTIQVSKCQALLIEFRQKNSAQRLKWPGNSTRGNLNKTLKKYHFSREKKSILFSLQIFQCQEKKKKPVRMPSILESEFRRKREGGRGRQDSNLTNTILQPETTCFSWALWSTKFFLLIIFAQNSENANESSVRQITAYMASLIHVTGLLQKLPSLGSVKTEKKRLWAQPKPCIHKAWVRVSAHPFF